MLLVKNGKIHFIKQTNENISEHIMRSWFIVNNLHIKDMSEMEKLSKIWIANRNYNCIYPSKYMDVIKELEGNFEV
jgi:hypothetical protein